MNFIDITKVVTLSLMIMFSFPSKGDVLNVKDYFNRLANDGENIWIATDKGIVRYNKTEERVYNANEILGIENNSTINCIDIDKNGNLWFSIEGKGCFSFDGEKVYTHIDFYREDLLRLSFAFGNNNQIWLSAGGYYVSITNDNTMTGYTTPDNQSILQSANIMDMELDSKGNLWISMFGEYNSLLCHKANNSYCEPIIAEGDIVIPSLTIDDNDNIWYSVVDGIYLYDTTTNEKIRYWNDTDKNIPAAHFFASDIDKDGNVWFTSSHYLLRYDGESFKWWNRYGYHNARGILCDENCVWIFMDNNSLFKFENEQFKSITLTEATDIKESTTEENSTKAYVSNGVLYVKSTKDIIVINVYDSLGREITPLYRRGDGGEAQISLPSTLKGVIMVKINNEVVKVAI